MGPCIKKQGPKVTRMWERIDTVPGTLGKVQLTDIAMICLVQSLPGFHPVHAQHQKEKQMKLPNIPEQLEPEPWGMRRSPTYRITMGEFPVH